MSGVTHVTPPNRPSLPEEFTPNLPHMSNTRSFWVKAVLVLALVVFQILMTAGIRPDDTSLTVTIAIAINLLIIGVSMSILGERTSKADYQRYVYRADAQQLLDQLHQPVTTASSHLRHMEERLASCGPNSRRDVLKALIAAKLKLAALIGEKPLPPLVLLALNLRRDEAKLLAAEAQSLRHGYFTVAVQELLHGFDTLAITELSRRYEELLVMAETLRIDDAAWSSLKDTFHNRLARRIACDEAAAGTPA